MSQRGEVPSRSQRVPVYKQAGQSVTIDLSGRVCYVCHRDNLSTANRKGELVAVGGKPVHLACAEEKDLAEKDESLRQLSLIREPLKFKARKFVPAAMEEVESILVLPMGIWEKAGPKTAPRLEASFRLANLAVPKPGMAMAKEAMAAGR